MSDVDVSIQMRAVGGGESAAEVLKAETAVNNLTASSSRMADKFQYKFQHIGLMLFARDSIVASGLGREAKQVIGLLNMALSEGASIAGLSSGGIMLVVAALGALVGIVAKVISHHREHLDVLKKVIEAHDKQIESLDRELESIHKYQAAVGTLPGILKQYENALTSARDAEAAGKREAVMQELSAKNLLAAQQKDKLLSIKAEIDEVTKLRDMFAKWPEGSMYKNSQAAIDKLLPSYNKQYTALKNTEAQIKADEVAMTKFGAAGIKAMTDQAEKTEKARVAAIKHGAELAKISAEEAKNISDNYYDMLEKTTAAYNKHIEQMAKTTEKYTDMVGGALGNAFGRMLVEGESFTKSMRNAFKQMAEAIIADIVRMIAKWAVFSAMSGMGGPAGAIGAAGLKGLGFATGGTVMVDKPTMLLAGEAGPEMATFTPLAAMGSTSTGSGQSGGGNTYNINMPISVSGVNDPDKIARDVGRKIVQQIRGSGQLDFVRS